VTGPDDDVPVETDNRPRPEDGAQDVDQHDNAVPNSPTTNDDEGWG
jgi:hypothetical protein